MDLIAFKEWKGSYALFELTKGMIYDNQVMDRIIISQEGDWIGEDAMMCHPQYDRYEDVQCDLGDGLFLLRKWFSSEKRRSYFEYKMIKNKSLLAVPATGEEIDFEIYGIGTNNNKILLMKRDL